MGRSKPSNVCQKICCTNGLPSISQSAKRFSLLLLEVASKTPVDTRSFFECAIFPPA